MNGHNGMSGLIPPVFEVYDRGLKWSDHSRTTPKPAPAQSEPELTTETLLRWVKVLVNDIEQAKQGGIYPVFGEIEGNGGKGVIIQLPHRGKTLIFPGTYMFVDVSIGDFVKLNLGDSLPFLRHRPHLKNAPAVLTAVDLSDYNMPYKITFSIGGEEPYKLYYWIDSGNITTCD